MPHVIAHIDAITRQKGRDALYIQFPKCHEDVSYSDYAVRDNIIRWLDEHGIGWQPCGKAASETGWESYAGQIYIDVPFDVADATYQLLHDFLENPDGTMRIDGAMFFYFPLALAMKNAHHDEPGFWEKWAETF